MTLSTVEKKVREELSLFTSSDSNFRLGKCSRDDYAQKSAMFHTKMSLEEHRREKIKQLKMLLTKLENGWDGTCTSCGEEIPLKRLLIVSTTLCVSCAEEIERKSKR